MLHCFEPLFTFRLQVGHMVIFFASELIIIRSLITKEAPCELNESFSISPTRNPPPCFLPSLGCPVRAFLLPRPLSRLYELESRVNIILFFWFDDEFANILANLLVESRTRESAIQLFVKAECVFNVIHRFMSSITYIRNETTDQTAVYRLRDVWHQLKTIVYGTEGSAETPVDVENIVERRPPPSS